MLKTLKEMHCDNRLVKKLIIIGSCFGFILLIANIDDNRFEYSSKEVNQNFEDSTPANQIWMENMGLIMEDRKRELEKNCEYLGLNTPGNDSLHRANPWEFLVNSVHHLVWCNVFKAASTSWMYNFNILAGYSSEYLQKTKQVPLQLARKKYPRPSLTELKKALEDSTSFLIVRHPLERLLSAYRDKIEFAIPNSYHHKMGTAIISKYRQKEKTTGGKRLSIKKRPTFPEFVRYLLDVYKSNSTFDMHWAPITSFCTPCHIRFDVIMKFETLQDDQNYLIQKRKLQKWIVPQWKNPSKGKSNTTHLVEKYYSQLTKQEIKQLYLIYRYDFELFGYNLDAYIKYGTSP